MRLFRRFPMASPNSISMMVWVMAPMAMKMVVTPKKIRKELKTRPARRERMDFAIPHRGHGGERHVEGIEGGIAFDDREAHGTDDQRGGDGHADEEKTACEPGHVDVRSSIALRRRRIRPAAVPPPPGTPPSCG